MKQFSDPETGHRRSDVVYMGTADVCERRHKPVSAAVDPRPFAFAFENGERLSGHTFDGQRRPRYGSLAAPKCARPIHASERARSVNDPVVALVLRRRPAFVLRSRRLNSVDRFKRQHAAASLYPTYAIFSPVFEKRASVTKVRSK